MTTIYLNSTLPEEIRRKKLYEGDVFVYSPTETSKALAGFARQMIEEAFAPKDPRKAQYSMPVDDYVSVVAPLKPRFIHHPESKRLIQDVLRDSGCDQTDTYLDVPRLRMVTSDGYLTSGVGYAHHPHRDTWYSAPMCQVNWWMPIYDIDETSAIAFHPRYWSQPVKNGSNRFNYYEWNAHGRASAAKHVKQDTRDQPKPEEPMALEPAIRVVCPAGGMILFSGANMHSTVPNVSGATRYSIDFRTISVADVAARRGAPNIDSNCTGTSLRDFMRCSDLERIPEEIVTPYDSLHDDSAVLLYAAAMGGETK
jgi:hypothetical protein